MKSPITLALTLLLTAGPFALAQSTASTSPEVNTPQPCQDCAARRKDWDSQPVHTFYLKYAVQPAEMNEINAVMRQMLSQDEKTFVVPEQAAILVRAIPEDMALAQRVIDDLDRPKKSWRLTYTLTELDGDKRIGTDHYGMDLVDGQQSTLKQGSRVPVATGPATAPQTQFNYQDVGATFDATLDQEGQGARLRSSITQTGVIAPAANGVPAPVFRDSSLKGAYLLTPNKPLILGTMDIPGSTHRLQIEVLMEPLP